MHGEWGKGRVKGSELNGLRGLDFLTARVLSRRRQLDSGGLGGKGSLPHRRIDGPKLGFTWRCLSSQNAKREGVPGTWSHGSDCGALPVLLCLHSL